MIRHHKVEGTDVYQFDVKGDIDAQGLEDFIALFNQKATDGEKVKLLGIIHELPALKSFKQLGTTAQLKFKALQRIEKYAVCSDHDWIESLFPVGNFLTPGIPVKHFDLDERDEALAWLAEDNIKTYDPEHYFTQLDIEQIDDSIYRFRVDKQIDEGGIAALYQLVKDKKKGEKIRLLGEVEQLPKIQSIKTLIDGLKLDFALIGHIDKYAVVSDLPWTSYATSIGDVFTPGLAMKHFKTSEKAQAIEWLKD